MRVGNNFNPTFIRSKGCRDCGQRIFYNMARHEWASDDGSSGFQRHACPKWSPTNKAKDEILDTILKKVSDIEWKQEKTWLTICEIKLKIDQVIGTIQSVE